MIICDEGLRLPVEEAFFSRFRRIETEGEVRYADPAHPEYGPMGVPDLGESLVFEICRSITGVPLNALKADGTNFWLSEEEEAKYASIRTPLTPVVSVRPWWKFWG